MRNLKKNDMMELGDYMVDKMINMMKNGWVSFPSSLLLNYKQIPIDETAFVVLIYLLHTKENFNPKKVSEELKIELPVVLTSMDELMTKELIRIQLVQKDGLMEEKLDFEGLYKKLAFLMTNEEVQEQVNTNIYDMFENEFGRSLSPIEYELINGWLGTDFKEEIIQLALKEAVYNGVSNLRYIDKILYEWKKKGLNSKEEIEKEKETFQAQKQKPKKELIDYDWLNENE